jgi:branched-chain amino acid transport system permease protein
LALSVTSPRLPSILRPFVPAVAISAVSLALFPMPVGVAVEGLILGLLGAMLAVGMALVYRANRILNFAQGELGTAPTVLAVSLVVYAGWNYLLALSVGLVGSLLVGALVELAVIRRFSRSPRLILTVATLGLAQLLSLGAVFIPMIWGKQPTANQVHFPLSLHFTIQPIVFSADYLVALIVAPLAMLGVAALLRFTSIGVAVRASAESADRASMLGVPVKRLQTVVWSVAALLSFTGIFLQAGIQGLPVISSLNLTVLLAALAALVMGNLVDLPAVAVSAVALGLLQVGVSWHNPSSPELVEPILGVVIVISLLVRKVGASRADQDRSSSWSMSDEIRPVPSELRSLPEVRALRWAAVAVLGGLALALPYWLQVGDQLKASAAIVFVIITMSVVVLTGWAGQVSLGQMSFAGFGGAVAVYSALHWNLDLSLTLLLAGLVGAAVAVIVGLPALRLRGFFLAVTTLAFAMAASAYLLNIQYFSWAPDPNSVVIRPHLFGGIGLASQRTYYYVCLAVLALAVLAVRGIRRSRTGRALLALRENERAAQAFGINILRAKLTAFAISGFLAALGGCLLVELLGGFSPDTYAPDQSFVIFTAAVVGGLGSLFGAALGSLYLEGAQWWLPGAQWQTLASAVGVLLVLMIIPGGLGQVVFRVRDAGLRWIANRRGLIVPSLVADTRQPDAASPASGTGDDERPRETRAADTRQPTSPGPDLAPSAGGPP